MQTYAYLTQYLGGLFHLGLRGKKKTKTEGFENVILDENYVYFTIQSYLGIILNTILWALISISFIRGLQTHRAKNLSLLPAVFRYCFSSPVCQSGLRCPFLISGSLTNVI